MPRCHMCGTEIEEDEGFDRNIYQYLLHVLWLSACLEWNDFAVVFYLDNTISEF